jgi:2-hydroxychromene-2-carboxylate isomerase
MGDLIRLADRRAAREARAATSRVAPTRVEFLFDLCCPYSYLAAERVDRIFDEVIWTPASTSSLRCGAVAADPEELAAYRSSAERRAAELRLPLIWPERFPEDVPAAMRAASYAAEQGRGAAFALAAGRLAFCGGFDLDDPELLAEAAAAAGIDMDGWLNALGEIRRDGEIEAAGRRLLAAGADRLPALRVGVSLFAGEHRVDEAAAAARRLSAVAMG